MSLMTDETEANNRVDGQILWVCVYQTYANSLTLQWIAFINFRFCFKNLISATTENIIACKLLVHWSLCWGGSSVWVWQTHALTVSLLSIPFSLIILWSDKPAPILTCFTFHTIIVSVSDVTGQVSALLPLLMLWFTLHFQFQLSKHIQRRLKPE